MKKKPKKPKHTEKIGMAIASLLIFALGFYTAWQPAENIVWVKRGCHGKLDSAELVNREWAEKHLKKETQ